MNTLQLLIILLILSSCGSTPTKTNNNTLGYLGSSQNNGNSVSKELAMLKNNPDSQVRDDGGWTIVQNGHTHWSFTPEDHEAHPAFSKREIVEKDGKVVIHMSITCGATKEACDRFVQAFKELNNKIRESFKEL